MNLGGLRGVRFVYTVFEYFVSDGMISLKTVNLQVRMVLLQNFIKHFGIQ